MVIVMSEIGWKEVIQSFLSVLATAFLVAMGIGLVWIIVIVLLLVTGHTTWALVVGTPLAIIVLVYLLGWIRDRITA